MRRLYADLHVHTALSPCADPGMTPVAVVRHAQTSGTGGGSGGGAGGGRIGE